MYNMGSSILIPSVTPTSWRGGTTLRSRIDLSSYSWKTNDLQLEPLEERSRVQRLVFMYKILNDHVALVAVPAASIDLIYSVLQTQWRRKEINIAEARRGPKGRSSKPEGFSWAEVLGDGAVSPLPTS